MSSHNDADFDGIREEDNKIPLGWLVFYFVLIAWGIVYFFLYMPQISGWSLKGNFDRQMQAERAAAPKAEALPAGNPFLTDQTAITEGKGIYGDHCAPCHAENLTGGFGPDLTAALKYGSAAEDIATTISGGRPGGMPSFKQQLDAPSVQKVTAYIISVRE